MVTQPEDIPEDVRKMAHNLVHETWDTAHASNAVARALFAYGQRRADEAREKAAKVCDDAAVEADEHMENAIFPDSKRNYASAHVTCKRLATAIRSQK